MLDEILGYIVFGAVVFCVTTIWLHGDEFDKTDED